MREGETPAPSSDRRDEDAPARWDPERIAGALQASMHVVRHVELGEGDRFLIPVGQEQLGASLAVYPQRALVRYRAGAVELDLGNVSTLDPKGELVQIESADATSHTTLSIQRTGSLLLTILPGPR